MGDKALEMAPDHIHLFVCHQPDYAISQVVQAFKGRVIVLSKERISSPVELPSYGLVLISIPLRVMLVSKVIMEYINDPITTPIDASRRLNKRNPRLHAV
jgi:putative transposase